VRRRGRRGDPSRSGKDGGHPDSRADAGFDGGADLEALDPTEATNLAYSSAFLYTGPNAIQTGVAAGTIDITRVSVIRGSWLDASAIDSPVVSKCVLAVR
jgi:hypothetical protein